jgi:hypothetical protein
MQFCSSEDLEVLAGIFCYRIVMTENYDTFCFLSLQKQEVKSFGALSREAQRRAWQWR